MTIWNAMFAFITYLNSNLLRYSSHSLPITSYLFLWTHIYLENKKGKVPLFGPMQVPFSGSQIQGGVLWSHAVNLAQVSTDGVGETLLVLLLWEALKRFLYIQKCHPTCRTCSESIRPRTHPQQRPGPRVLEAMQVCQRRTPPPVTCPLVHSPSLQIPRSQLADSLEVTITH